MPLEGVNCKLAWVKISSMTGFPYITSRCTENPTFAGVNETAPHPEINSRSDANWTLAEY